MPYPSQIDRQRIVRQARRMIETEGVAQLSLGKLARALGVKAPSLYRYVSNKDDLLRAVNLLTIQQLFAALDEALAAAPQAPQARLLAVAGAYRAFAHANPQTYVMAFTNSVDAQRPDEDVLEQLALPLQELVAAITGPEQSLAALRGIFALIHGFVMLELNRQLRRGGDLAEAFGQSVEAYIEGWEQRSF